MIIYGTALLAACHLLGIFLGDLLGQALGVKTNVGGVGIAMLLLIFARLYMAKQDLLPKLTELGVEWLLVNGRGRTAAQALEWIDRCRLDVLYTCQ